MLYNYNPETKKAEPYVRFKKIKDMLKAIGRNNLTDKQIEQFQHYYLFEQILFELHAEFGKIEVKAALLEDL